jgi:hypothetical protein
MAQGFFDGYKIRLPDSATFAEYAVDQLKRLLGSKMLVDFSDAIVNNRLAEKPAPKTINEEMGFLLRGVYRRRKSKKFFGSSGRTRTYNPSVNRTIENGISTTSGERPAA